MLPGIHIPDRVHLTLTLTSWCFTGKESQWFEGLEGKNQECVTVKITWGSMRVCVCVCVWEGGGGGGGGGVHPSYLPGVGAMLSFKGVKLSF